MRIAAWTMVCILTAPAGSVAQEGGAPARRRVRPTLPPSVSVRPPDTAKRIRTSVERLFGWKVGVTAKSFTALTFSEAAARADELHLTSIQGFPGIQVSSAIPRKLSPDLTPEQLAQVKHRLDELRLQLTAYEAGRIPEDSAGLRKLFAFAKTLNVAILLVEADRPALQELDQLANEFEVSVGLMNMEPGAVRSRLEGLSQRIGVYADMRTWMEQGIRPLDALQLVHDRLLAVHLGDRSRMGPAGRDVELGEGVAGIGEFFLELSRLQPPGAIQWPPACGNCGGPRVSMRPLYLVLESDAAPDSFGRLTRSLEAFETLVRPAMGHRVNEIARNTPITSPDRVTPEQRQKIEAAIPRQPVVKPRRPGKLLILDVCPAGSFYHATIAHANLALELMARNTGAFEPVFSNHLENLKYPKIREFDAVFLNNVGGGSQLFADPDVLAGLLRFVREGGGLAGLHGSSYASMDLPQFGEMIGAQDGPHRVETATIKIDDPNSPLTSMFAGRSFEWVDEFYHFLPEGPYSREKLHVLLSIDAEKSDLSRWNVRPDRDYGLSWIRSYGKGRVFNCALGHTPEFFATPVFAEFILAGIQFALGDLEADTTPSALLAK